MKKQIMCVLAGMLLAGCLAGCASAGNDSDRRESYQAGDMSSSVRPLNEATAAEGCGSSVEISHQELFKAYEEYGLLYYAAEDELTFNGKKVRWFEDYYPVGEGSQAGVDFFREDGVTDVHAVRDFSKINRNPDGSYNPAGILTGVEEFSEEEFARRDMEALKNQKQATAVEGEEMSPQETMKMAEEYAPYGVTYDVRTKAWYYQGEMVRVFQDILMSNGERLSGGKFKGVMRTFGNEDGTVDIYTVRDYSALNSEGYGTLTGVEKYSQEEFDQRTEADFTEYGNTAGTAGGRKH